MKWYEESASNMGLYTMRQAAAIAQITYPAKLKRWLFGVGGDAAVRSFVEPNEEGLISFIDLFQAMAIRNIRIESQKQNAPGHHKKKFNITLRQIRQTIDFAANKGIAYPFARRHTTYVFDDDVVIRLADGQLVQATGKYKNEQLIDGVANFYMNDVSFDIDGLADKWVAMRDNGRAVILRRSYQFGAPVVTPCGYTVEALVNSIQSEGSIQAASRALGVELDDISLALRYENHLLGKAA